MKYYLSSLHWIDAMTPPIFERIDELISKIEEPYEEVNSLKEFIRSHTDEVFVDFACDGGKIKAAAADCAGLFSGFSDLQSIQNLGNLDTSACSNFERMFYSRKEHVRVRIPA